MEAHAPDVRDERPLLVVGLDVDRVEERRLCEVLLELVQDGLQHHGFEHVTRRRAYRLRLRFDGVVRQNAVSEGPTRILDEEPRSLAHVRARRRDQELAGLFLLRLRRRIAKEEARVVGRDEVVAGQVHTRDRLHGFVVRRVSPAEHHAVDRADLVRRAPEIVCALLRLAPLAHRAALLARRELHARVRGVAVLTHPAPVDLLLETDEVSVRLVLHAVLAAVRALKVGERSLALAARTRDGPAVRVGEERHHLRALLPRACERLERDSAEREDDAWLHRLDLRAHTPMARLRCGS